MRIPIPFEQLKHRLIEERLVTGEEFDALAEEARRKQQNLLDVLVSDKAIEPNYLSGLIAEYLGVDMASLDAHSLDPDMIRLLPEDVARQREAIIFGREEDGALMVAMADPSDLESIKFLTQFLKAKIHPFLATSNDLNRGFSVYGLKSATDFKQIIESNIEASLKSRTAKSVEEAAAELPIVSIVDSLLSYAISSRASDIHIEALEDAVLVRYRIDGILYEVMRIPKAVHAALLARFKLLSGLKIDEHYKPQDGRFRYTIVNQFVDVRVSIMPTYYGEKIVMRILESAQKPLSLEELGMLPNVATSVSQNLARPFGMILTCGPTGSGKSTTLYALINLLNKPNVNIVTVEDPVEYNMRYVNQTQINPQAGITFASGLRAILRQDPNVIMVGEIRDSETADIAVQAALTGHLVLSSLHTNDAATAVPRLFDFHIPPFLVASVLNVVIAQRLLRKICPSCVGSYQVDQNMGKAITFQLEAVGVPVDSISVPKTIYRGAGCAACNGSGYRGRLGIYEVLAATDSIRKLIISPEFSLESLMKISREEGMRSMLEDGLAKVELGLTTVEEVLRVIRE